MRTSIRALPVILIGAFVATAGPIATTPVGAAVGGRTFAADRAAKPPQVLPADDLRVTPVGAPRVAVSVDPGASSQRSFVVSNRSAGLRLTVRLESVDASARSDGVVHYGTRASTGGPAQWLTLSDVVATLEPGATVRVSMTVTPPANAEPGDVLAGVVVRVDHAVQTSDDAAVADDAAVSLPVAINVKGAATALVSIVNVRAVKHGAQSVLEITFLNSGATANTMIGHAQVLGPQPRTVPVRASVAPLAHTIVRVPLPMPPDKNTVRVSVTAEAAGGDQAAWSGTVGLESDSSALGHPAGGRTRAARRSAKTPSSHKETLPSPTLVLVGLAFLAAVLWFGAELKRSRKRRGAITRAAPTPTLVSRAEVRAPGAGIEVPAPHEFEQMGAVAAQLGALVDAIDRLVGRLGGVPAASAPVAPAAAPVGEPMTEPPEALFYAPAASPPASTSAEPYPYDWPTQAQLDQFAARRREAQADTP